MDTASYPILVPVAVSPPHPSIEVIQNDKFVTGRVGLNNLVYILIEVSLFIRLVRVGV